MHTLLIATRLASQYRDLLEAQNLPGLQIVAAPGPEVDILLGRGGMAEVHLGYDTRLGRQVAIKMLRSELARDQTFLTRFRREAQSAAGLNHASIVAVYDHGEDAVIEIKTKEPHILIDLLERGTFPVEHAKQIQGQLWATGRARCHFVAYWPRLPLFHCIVERDEALIERIAAAVVEFNAEAATLETKLKGMLT